MGQLLLYFRKKKMEANRHLILWHNENKQYSERLAIKLRTSHPAKGKAKEDNRTIEVNAVTFPKYRIDLT